VRSSPAGNIGLLRLSGTGGLYRCHTDGKGYTGQKEIPTATQQSPTVRRRRLALELRRFRDAAGLTCEEVAEHLECSTSKISRIETGRVSVSPRDVRDMLQLYGVPGPQQDNLVQLARESRQKGWWHAYSDAIEPRFATYIGLESAASEIRIYEVTLIPGLLQTEDYARAVISGVLPMATEIEVDQRVQARLERQQLLAADEPLDLWAVMDEAAVRRLVGGRRVMEAQAAHLIDMTHQANITIQVIPYGAGAHPGMPGSFVYVEFKDPADSDLVYIDTMAGDLFLESETDLRRYGSMFDHLRAVALSPNETVSLLTSMPGKYRVTPVTSGSKGG
jgi:transcriptional regulator with XRE-family HTH domain